MPAVLDAPETPAQPPQGLWGEDVEWPDQWRNRRAPNQMRDGPIIATEGVKETALRLAASQVPRALGKPAGAPAMPVEPGRWGKEVDWPGQWQNIPGPTEMTVRPKIATTESEEATSRPAAPQWPADLDTPGGGREKPEQPDPAPTEMTVEPDIATAGSGEEKLGSAAPQVPTTRRLRTPSPMCPKNFAYSHDSTLSDGTVEVDIATERSPERIPRVASPQLPAASAAPADKPEKAAKSAWEQWVQSPRYARDAGRLRGVYQPRKHVAPQAGPPSRSGGSRVFL